VTPTLPTFVRPLQSVERRERHVEVRDPASHRELATIEVLSLVNKASGDAGRERFLAKRAALVAGVYQRGRYADSLDYDRPPPPPRLRPADEAWAAERIRSWRGARLIPARRVTPPTKRATGRAECATPATRRTPATASASSCALIPVR
jgi:hypothetical protein